MFSEHIVKDAMNKELSQLINKKSFEEVDSKTLTPQQLQQVVATRWVITQRPTNNGQKDIKCRFCGKAFSQFIHDTDTHTFAATPSSMVMRVLLTTAILKQFTVFTTDVANASLNTPIDNEVLVQPKEYYHSNPHILWRMTKSTILQQLGFTRLKSDACVFANNQSTIYIIMYVDDLLVVGDNATTQPCLQQFQQHLEFKRTSRITTTTTTTPLEFIGKTIQLQDDGTIHLSFAPQCYHKILKAYNMDKRNPSTTSGNKNPPIATQPIDKEQHSVIRTAVGQLLWVSQLRFIGREGAQSCTTTT
eukprot:4528161-Amphidinium_carterae.4